MKKVLPCICETSKYDLPMLVRKIYNRSPLVVQKLIHFLKVKINANRIGLLVLANLRQRNTLRSLNRHESPILLRLGESEKSLGWVCSNYENLARNFIDARKPFSVKPGIRLIYADNVIEHLNLQQGYSMLENAFSALIPGGSIRLATPDLRNIALAYLEGKQESIDQFKENFSPHGIQVNYFSDLFHATFHYFGHQYGYIYDLETLDTILREIGFTEITQYQSGQSDVAEFKNIEKRMKSSDMWGQLCVEARKPLNRV